MNSDPCNVTIPVRNTTLGGARLSFSTAPNFVTINTALCISAYLCIGMFVVIFLRNYHSYDHLKIRSKGLVISNMLGALCIITVGPLNTVVGDDKYLCFIKIIFTYISVPLATAPNIIRLLDFRNRNDFANLALKEKVEVMGYFPSHGSIKNRGSTLNSTKKNTSQQERIALDIVDGDAACPIMAPVKCDAISPTTSDLALNQSGFSTASISDIPPSYVNGNTGSILGTASEFGGANKQDGIFPRILKFMITSKFRATVIITWVLPFFLAGIIICFTLPRYLFWNLCVGCRLSVMDVIIVAVSGLFALIVAAIGAIRVRKLHDPFKVIRETKLYFGIAGFMAILSFGLDNFYGVFGDGIFTFQWPMTISVVIGIYIVAVYPVYLAKKSEDGHCSLLELLFYTKNADIDDEFDVVLSNESYQEPSTTNAIIIASPLPLAKTVKAPSRKNMNFIQELKELMSFEKSQTSTRRAFEEQMISEFAAEVYRFYEMTEAWKNGYDDATEKTRLALARKICRVFVAKDALFCVNLSEETLNKTLQAMEKNNSGGNIPKSMFNEARNECFKMMIPAYLRFLKLGGAA